MCMLVYKTFNAFFFRVFHLVFQTAYTVVVNAQLQGSDFLLSQFSGQNSEHFLVLYGTEQRGRRAFI